MYKLIFTLPDDIISSAYGCGNYGSGSYDNSCSPQPNNQKSSSGSSSGSGSSSSGSSSNTNSSVASGAITLQVLSVDDGTPFVSSTNVETVSTSPTLSGTAPPGSKVVITVEPQGVTCSATANAQGIWSCKLSTITPGSHTVNVTATTPQGQVLNFPPFKLVAVKITSTTTSHPPKTSTNHGLSGTAWTGIVITGVIALILIIWLILAFIRRRRGKQPPQNGGPTVTPSSGDGLNQTL